MKEKVFWLPADAIKPNLAPNRGSCIASDMITVHGHPVCFMYRDDPDGELDSGWRFFSGTETQEFCDDPDNLALYDVNTIANYDRDIIPLLDASYGCAFERKSKLGKFAPAEFPKDPDRD